VRRPRTVLAGAIALLLLLGGIGISVEDKLEPTSLSIPGTEAARGDQMLREHFGDSAPFAVMLRGPSAQLEKQGPRLIFALHRDPKVTTISPWDRGPGLETLRPNERTALILVDFHVTEREAIKTTVSQLEDIVARNVGPPLSARVAGYATIGKAIEDQSIEVAKRGEVILAPILLLVLLIVFRSPIAAAIPLAFGASTVIASRGLMSIAANFFEVSGFALSIASMVGLALGVDYALLIVSRFREELAAGNDPAGAATITRATAGRTTVFAGSTLLIAILVAVFLVPGNLLISLCATVVAVLAVAVAGPWIFGPAILVLVGPHIDRWRIGKAAPGTWRWMPVSRWAIGKPYLAVFASLALLVLIAAPATTLSTAPLTIDQLPADDPSRLDVEAIQAQAGGGWIAPADVVIASSDGPITEPRRLAAISRWQAQIARDADVEAVIGPGPLVRPVKPLRKTGREFIAAGGTPEGRVDRATRQLSRAGSGLARLRDGLSKASLGAGALALGSGRARQGAGLLAEGLSLASSGGSRAGQALRRFDRGMRRLAEGQRGALLGTTLLGFSVGELEADVSGVARPESKRLSKRLGRTLDEFRLPRQAAAETLARLEEAWGELGQMTVGSGDPRYPELQRALREALTAAGGSDPVGGGRYAPGYDGLPAALGRLQEQLADQARSARRLESTLSGTEDEIALLGRLAARLERGSKRLLGGSARLAHGSDRIVGGAERLNSGLVRLDRGADRLSGGLARLEEGNRALARGLSYAYRRTRPLVTGARQAEARIESGRRRLRRGSPGIFDSGYFVLSAIDGAPPHVRELAGQSVDLKNGGQAAQVLVISNRNLSGHAARRLNDSLRGSIAHLAAATGTEAALTGGLATNTDYVQATGSRLPILMVTITLLTFLTMIVVLRALPLAAIAIALNLLTVAAAFGMLKVLNFIPEGAPFGGTTHVDPVGIAGIFGVVFGLSIDYSVFLLSRMRERWETSGDNEAAIVFGLERTAGVITGAAVIMAIVFGVLGTAPIDTVAQFGVGLTVAILLDATIIRLILMPSLMRLFGPKVWWIPSPLARVIPKIELHG
jgi:RND superfamily putative drug exporter